MDPKGDRLRKIQSGQLKLPESVLKVSKEKNVCCTAPDIFTVVKFVFSVLERQCLPY